MFRTVAALALVTACTSSEPPDGATHSATWACMSEICESPIAGDEYASLFTATTGGAEIASVAWGDGHVSHAGRMADGCFRFPAGEDDGVARDEYALCQSGDRLSAAISWGASTWTVTLSPL